MHRSRDPIAGTSTSFDRSETSTTAEWWQFLLWQYAAIVRTPFARMFPSVMDE